MLRRLELSDLQALVLALFVYGIARTPTEVSQALRIPAEQATEVCGELDEAGLVALSESG